jgi:hypothetical protein
MPENIRIDSKELEAWLKKIRDDDFSDRINIKLEEAAANLKSAAKALEEAANDR